MCYVSSVCMLPLGYKYLSLKWLIFCWWKLIGNPKTPEAIQLMALSPEDGFKSILFLSFNLQKRRWESDSPLRQHGKIRHKLKSGWLWKAIPFEASHMIDIVCALIRLKKSPEIIAHNESFITYILILEGLRMSEHESQGQSFVKPTNTPCRYLYVSSSSSAWNTGIKDR